MLASTLSQNVYADQPYRKEEVSRRFWFYWFFAPDVLGEPFFIFFHDGALLLRFGDAVAKALVHDEFYRSRPPASSSNPSEFSLVRISACKYSTISYYRTSYTGVRDIFQKNCLVCHAVVTRFRRA